MALISVADSFNISWYSAWYFSPLSCNYRRVANSLLPRGTGQKAQQLQPVPFRKAEVKSVVPAAQLGTCPLPNAEGVRELPHPLLLSPGAARCPTDRPLLAGCGRDGCGTAWGTAAVKEGLGLVQTI